MESTRRELRPEFLSDARAGCRSDIELRRDAPAADVGILGPTDAGDEKQIVAESIAAESVPPPQNLRWSETALFQTFPDVKPKYGRNNFNPFECRSYFDLWKAG
jgi:hypothetical protein